MWPWSSLIQRWAVRKKSWLMANSKLRWNKRQNLSFTRWPFMENASLYRPWMTASTWFMTELCSKSSGSKRRKRMPSHGKTRIVDMIHMLYMILETLSIGLSRLQQEKQALNKRLTFKWCIVRMKKVKPQESRETCQKMLGSVVRLSQSSTVRKTRCTLIWNLL